MRFQTLKPIHGLKTNGTDTPIDEIVELDPDDPNTIRLVEANALKPIAEPEAPIDMTAEPVDAVTMTATPEDGGFPTDMTAPKPKKSKKL